MKLKILFSLFILIAFFSSLIIWGMKKLNIIEFKKIFVEYSVDTLSIPENLTAKRLEMIKNDIDEEIDKFEHLAKNEKIFKIFLIISIVANFILLYFTFIYYLRATGYNKIKDENKKIKEEMKFLKSKLNQMINLYESSKNKTVSSSNLDKVSKSNVIITKDIIKDDKKNINTYQIKQYQDNSPEKLLNEKKIPTEKKQVIEETKDEKINKIMWAMYQQGYSPADIAKTLEIDVTQVELRLKFYKE